MKMRLLILILITATSSCFAQRADSIFNLIEKNKRETFLIADDYVRNIIGARNFENYFSRAMKYSYLDSKPNSTWTSYEDSVKFIPTVYKARYLIHIESIKYDEITIEFDSNMTNLVDSTHYAYHDLIGWRNTLNGTYKILPSDVYDIASDKNQNFSWNKPQLRCSRNDPGKPLPYFYYWRIIQDDCEECISLEISCINGKILKDYITINKITE